MVESKIEKERRKRERKEDKQKHGSCQGACEFRRWMAQCYAQWRHVRALYGNEEANHWLESTRYYR